MGKLFKLSSMITMGAIAGLAVHLKNEKKYSNITIDRYNDFIDNAKEVGSGIKNSYEAIDNKSNFKYESDNLKYRAKELIKSTAGLISSAGVDMFSFIGDKIGNAIDNMDTETKHTSKRKKKKK